MSDNRTSPLPDGWSWQSVGELAAQEPHAITDGPFGSKLKTAHYTASGPRVIRLQNIGEAQFIDAHAHVSEEHFGTLQKHRVFPADIVIAALGQTLPRACLIPDWLGPAIVKADCIRFKPRAEHSAQYLTYALNWEGTRKRTKTIVHGVGRPRLNLSEIRSVQLPVAPPDKQPNIVAEIEKQFTRLDAGVSALKRVQANLKRYRAAVLKAACEGRLVPTEAELARREDRAYETGGELLASILEERRRKWMGRGKYKTPVPAQMDWLGPIPEGWGIASADQISSHITSGSRDWSQFYGKGSGVFVLAQNVRPMFLDLSAPQLVDAPKDDPETERTRVEVDDLLVTIVGAKTRDVCRVPRELRDHFVCQSVALLRPVLPRTSQFVELYLVSPENGQAQWKRFVYGQGRPHLSFEQLRMTAIPLPPLAEQARIVSEVERRLSVADEIEATVAANLQRATRLRQVVLHSAFSGRLADGPVSA